MIKSTDIRIKPPGPETLIQPSVVVWFKAIYQNYLCVGLLIYEMEIIKAPCICARGYQPISGGRTKNVSCLLTQEALQAIAGDLMKEETEEQCCKEKQ